MIPGRVDHCRRNSLPTRPRQRSGRRLSEIHRFIIRKLPDGKAKAEFLRTIIDYFSPHIRNCLSIEDFMDFEEDKLREVLQRLESKVIPSAVAFLLVVAYGTTGQPSCSP